MNALRITAILLTALALVACDKSSQDQEVSASSTQTQTANEAEEASGSSVQTHGMDREAAADPHAGMQMASANAGPDGAMRAGEVLETMDAAGYTYALVQTSAGNIWIAGPETAVKVGNQIRFPAGTPMEKFHSNSLDREFARIDFVPAIEVVKSDPGNADAAPPAPPNTSGGVGIVKETMDASGYTYALLTMESGEEKWVAGPQTELQVGQKVGISKGDAMDDFHSPSLDRTFERLELVGSISPLDAAAAPTNDTQDGGETVPGVAEHTTADAAGVTKMEPPEGGVTVADIHAKKKDLNGKEVKIRGKVVKYNANILNANWLHIQDGSGAAAEGTHDITVTTAETAAVGDVVVVTGKVAVDKDFGAGYRYDVMVEEATLAAE